MEEQGISAALHTVEEAAVSAANQTVGKVTSGFVSFCRGLLTWENMFKVIGVVLILLFITVVFRLLKKVLSKGLAARFDTHQMLLVHKTVHYVYYVTVIFYILSVFGVKLSAIWGAAGIAGVAIGFAAQTSVSNLISGLFVLSERTMKIGDFISVGGVSGTVDSVGLLSVRIHNTDNQLIRIPNSTIINTNFQNNNFYEERRMNFSISIAYDTDMTLALETLRKVPEMCPTVLKTPASAVWYDGFGDSGINMTLAVWFNPSDLIQTKNDVFISMKKVFDDAGIEIPFSRIDVSILSSAAQ